MINLNTDGITPSTTSDNVLESTTFHITLQTKPRAHPTERYRMHVSCAIEYPMLRHRYITGHCGLGPHETLYSEYDSKITDLVARLNDQTVVELFKIEEDKRPVGSRAVTAGGHSVWMVKKHMQLPDNAKFLDDEVVEYPDRAWREQVEIEEKEENDD
jgi:hypothetical protein